MYVLGPSQNEPESGQKHIYAQEHQLYCYNNRRSESAFDDLDSRLFFLYQVGDDVIRPSKICRGCVCVCVCVGGGGGGADIHGNQRCPIQSRL